jgi:hypothetical protein
MKETNQKRSLIVCFSIALIAIVSITVESIFTSTILAESVSGANSGTTSMSPNSMQQNQIIQSGIALPPNAIISIPFGQMAMSGSSFVIGSANSIVPVPEGSIVTIPAPYPANNIFGTSISVPFGSVIGPCSSNSINIGNTINNNSSLSISGNMTQSSNVGGISKSCLYLQKSSINSLMSILPPNSLNNNSPNTSNSSSNETAGSTPTPTTNSPQIQPSVNATG